MADEAFTTFFKDQNIKIAGTTMEPLFHTADIADKINDKNVYRTIRGWDTEFVVKISYIADNVQTNFFTEDGLYQYLMRSKLPGAQPFQKWVRDQLKIIRKRIVDDLRLAAKQATENLKLVSAELNAAMEDLKTTKEELAAVNNKLTVTNNRLNRALEYEAADYDDTHPGACPIGLADFYIYKNSPADMIIDDDLYNRIIQMAKECFRYVDSYEEFDALVQAMILG
jgi:prophage antirepressor-like protein